MNTDALSMGNAVTMRAGNGGQTLGRIDQYEILRELGGGGFGTVYLARDTVSGVEVAVKGLPPLVRNNQEELENIRTNFALVSRLHHPHIAAALVLHPARSVSYAEKDVAEKLRVFGGDTLMVMEYAPGETLSRWRKRFPEEKVPVVQAVLIVKQIAQALDYAHERRLIHRDVKPSNVMIETRSDGTPVARVLDFGLAAEIRSSMGRISREIRDTSGTRPYMAPEQWLGGRQGPATDQYSLAVLFCELVSGEVPFASVFDTGDPAVMMNVVGHEKPILPSGLPRSERRALERALSKDAASRYDCCEDFVRDLSSEGLSRWKPNAWMCGLAALVLLGPLSVILLPGFSREERVHSKSEQLDLPLTERHEEQIHTVVVSRVETVEKDNALHIKQAVREAISSERRDAELAAQEEREREERSAYLRQLMQRVRSWIESSEEFNLVCKTKQQIPSWSKDPEGVGSALAELNARFKLFDEAVNRYWGPNPTTVIDDWEKAPSELSLLMRRIAESESLLQVAFRHRENFRRSCRYFAEKGSSLTSQFRLRETASAEMAAVDDLRERAKRALAEDKPAEAEHLADKAQALFSETVAKTRKENFNRLVLAAEREVSNENWRACLSLADEARLLRPNDGRVQSLLSLARYHILPSLRMEFVCVETGRPVETVRLYDFHQMRHFRSGDEWPVSTGDRIATHEVYATEMDGSTLAGRIDAVDVRWEGPKVVRIEMRRRTENAPGSRKVISLANGEKIVMIWIPDGVSKGEGARKGSTKGFWMSDTEITQKQWFELMKSCPAEIEKDDVPVTRVTWRECADFVARINRLPATDRHGLTFRMPTSAEWQYAASGAGYGEPPTNAGSRTFSQGPGPVRGREPSVLGLFGMAGNVREWCADIVNREFRAVLGGDWHANDSLSAGCMQPSCRCPYTGFRIVAEE